MSETALGLEIDYVEDPADPVTTDTVLVISRGFDGDGNEVWSISKSRGLTDIASLAFVEFASEHVHESVRQTLRA